MIRKHNMVMGKKFTYTLTAVTLAAMLGGCSMGGAGKANINLGMDAVEQQDYAMALTCFDNALKAGEDERLTYRGMGIAYMGQGRYEEAVGAFEKALKGSNGLVKRVDYDINYYMAMSEYKCGDLDAALDTYNAILDLDERSADAHYLRGRIELLKNDRESAIKDFDRAVELKHNDYDLYICIYQALDAAGMKSDGDGYLSRAMSENNRMTAYQSGMFSYYLGRYDEARNYFEEARKDEETPELILYLGRSYEALGDTNYASNLYSAYTDEHQDSAAIYNELGLMSLKQKEYQKALNAFENGISLNDPAYDQSLRFNEAVAYEYLLDFKKAGVLMKEYIDRYPQDEEAQREYIFLSTR